MNNDNKWGALSMRDRAFLIRQAVKNGITDLGSIRDTWEHRFDGTKDTVNGGEIPAVTVIPAKWQKEFSEFSRKNPEIREMLDEWWVLPDRRRRSRVMEIQFDKDFLEGNMDYDEYEKHYFRQKNRTNRFPVYYDTSSDLIYKRFLDVYKAAGEPKIYTGEGRPFYLKLPIGKHSVHNISTPHNLMEELAHPIEGTGIITYLKDLPKTLKGELTGTYEHYSDPSHFEYKTHEIVEPSLTNYILEGEHTPYIHKYSGEEETAESLMKMALTSKKDRFTYPGQEIVYDRNRQQAIDDINQRLVRVENSKTRKGGWDKTREVWIPHKSFEGGYKTIGYGLKLTPGSEVKKISRSTRIFDRSTRRIS